VPQRLDHASLVRQEPTRLARVGEESATNILFSIQIPIAEKLFTSILVSTISGLFLFFCQLEYDEEITNYKKKDQRQ
jgi:hypothetical protein